MTKKYDCAMTHGGKFHADDVFSAALLKIAHPDIRFIRAFEVPGDFDGIVFDIGFGKFDHHQKDAEIRVNGVPYASFGLLWREYGEEILSTGCPPEQAAKEAARFDERFIQPLDEDDNTGCGSQIGGTVGTFNPCWDSEDSADECFAEAVEFAFLILSKKINSILSINRAKKLVETALLASRDNIVVLPRFAPWKMILLPSNSLFVIYPSQRGGYCAQGIPVDSETKELRCSFPGEWAGMPSIDLPGISGIATLTFCHKGRFLISANTLEDAAAACKLSMKLHGVDSRSAARQDSGTESKPFQKTNPNPNQKANPNPSPKPNPNPKPGLNPNPKPALKPDPKPDFRMDCWKKLKMDEV